MGARPTPPHTDLWRRGELVEEGFDVVGDAGGGQVVVAVAVEPERAAWRLAAPEAVTEVGAVRT